MIFIYHNFKRKYILLHASSLRARVCFLSLSAFSTNIPNLPIQIMAVTDTGGANAFFSSDLSHLLITEGNAIADKLEAHFMTSASSCQQKSKIYIICTFFTSQKQCQQCAAKKSFRNNFL